jgi:hypothetical protein
MAAFTAWLCVLPSPARDLGPIEPSIKHLEDTRTNRKLRRGQHGGDLQLLRSYYRPPQARGESNHFFDLWDAGSLATFAAVQGLTNNRALLIDSHGADQFSWSGPQYVFRPNAKLLPPGAEAPSYSIRDIARVIGPEAAATIHNLVVAGCNEGGALKSSDFRRYFVNATNITFMASGYLAYKPTFFQVLTRHSEAIEPLYGYPVADRTGPAKMEISRQCEAGAVLLGTYVADLYQPGASKPYRRQLAGRELLEPDCPRRPHVASQNREPPGTRSEPAMSTFE